MRQGRLDGTLAYRERVVAEFAYDPTCRKISKIISRMLFDWREVESSLSFVVVKIAVVVFTTMDSNASMRCGTYRARHLA